MCQGRAKLIPFARRDDCDDIACFEVGKGNKVQIIHDFAGAGYEQRKEYELEMDEEGWVPVEQLLDALHRDKKWKNISEGNLATVIQTSEKKRHEICNEKIILLE